MRVGSHAMLHEWLAVLDAFSICTVRYFIEVKT
jgi:hypothetical protein